MQTVRIYKVTTGNQVTITPKRPPKGGYRVLSRLIADPGKVLTDGTMKVSVIDTSSPESWIETDE